jgi:hypothetical protein
MQPTSNIKDTLSTICGILAAIGGGILVAGQTGVTFPTWVTAVAGAMTAICTAIIGYLTGKTPAAAKKTEEQVIDQNTPNP